MRNSFPGIFEYTACDTRGNIVVALTAAISSSTRDSLDATAIRVNGYSFLYFAEHAFDVVVCSHLPEMDVETLPKIFQELARVARE